MPSSATTPFLSIRCPSQTTAEFTVSSHPPPSLPLRALLAVFLAARLLLALVLISLLYLRLFPSRHHIYWPYYPLFHSHHHHHHHHHRAVLDNNNHDNDDHLGLLLFSYLQPLLATSAAVALGRFLVALSARLPVLVLAPGVVLACWAATRRVGATESLVVFRGLGIQTRSTPTSWLSRPATRFILTRKILDILINEAFLGFEVRYYLVVIVEGEDDVVVVFPELLPGRGVVEAVWRGVRGCLWEGAGVRRVGGESKEP